jgi:hypothetical protein
MTLNEFISKYPRVRLANSKDNASILSFFDQVFMETGEGGLGVDRDPDFFALGKAQGEKSFTFLFCNEDDSIGGIGCISIMPMQIEGELQWIAYNCDLKFSPKIEKKTRMAFYLFYESLVAKLSEIEDFNGAKTMFASILDGNTAALKALVTKKKRLSQLHHQAFYSYENINVLARLPLPLRGPSDLQVKRGSEFSQDELIDFLTSNPDGSTITWSREEILRRQRVSGFSFEDFIVVVNGQNEIQGMTLLLTDSEYRQLKVRSMPKVIKYGQIFTSLLGQPRIIEDKPMNIGYLSFVKILSQDVKVRADIYGLFLNEVFRIQSALPKSNRYHVLNFQEPQGHEMSKRLLTKGFLSKGLNSTLYQAVHEKSAIPTKQLPMSQKRVDFDPVFH